jgi:hypothetical protein
MKTHTTIGTHVGLSPSTYVRSVWHTSGLGGREARSEAGLTVAKRSQKAEKTNVYGDSNQSPRRFLSANASEQERTGPKARALEPARALGGWVAAPL